MGSELRQASSAEKALIFVSYAREDVAHARSLVKALESLGAWRCWWDPKLRAGDHYDQEILTQLEAAACVVVLWSRHSVQSGWVKDEAGVAQKRGVLVPFALDESEAPMGFRSQHVRRLSGWDESGPRELEDVVADIAAAMMVQPHSVPPRKNKRLLARFALPAAVLLASSIWWVRRPAQQPVETVPSGQGPMPTATQTVSTTPMTPITAPLPTVAAGGQSTTGGSSTGTGRVPSGLPGTAKTTSLQPNTDPVVEAIDAARNDELRLARQKVDALQAQKSASCGDLKAPIARAACEKRYDPPLQKAIQERDALLSSMPR